MGKWTSEYYDDVLGAKIKCLVSGAVKRSKLEKAEPTISYEAFVEDLDPGDSFTTTLTELLVREMAERRQRQAAADRRLISDRTAKGLRTLASPQRVYRDRGIRSLNARRSLNLTDYLAMPPEEMELDDDNDSLESMVDLSGGVEGARTNSDLYDAYANPGVSSTEPHFSPAPPHLRHVLRSATRREDWAFLRDTSPDGWGPPSPVTAPSAPPLTRQPSIRRLPARSRTVDFTDFTSRRRSFGREGSNVVASGDTEADDSATQTTGTAASETSPRATPNTTSVPPRRFFPSRRPELPWSPVPESATTSTSTSTSTSTGSGTGTGVVATPSGRSSPAPAAMTTTTTATQAAEARDQRTFLSWLPSSTLLPLPPHPPADLRSPRPTPRLRRGGVRPPESLLGRPHVMVQSPEPMGSAITFPLPAGSPGVGVDGGMPSLGDAAPTPAPDSSAPVGAGAPRGLSPAPTE